MGNDKKQQLAIVAGQGKFPVILAQEARNHGVETFAIALKGYTSSEIEDYVTEIRWFDLGQISEMLKTAKESGIRDVALAGRVPHEAILHYTGFDTFSRGILSLLGDKKANSILKMITSVLAKNGLNVIDASRYLKKYIPGKGLLTPGRPLSIEDEQEIKFGLPLAKNIAAMDIGMTIVVKDKIVVAVEGMEGTDKTIQRAAELAGDNVVVIKVARPNQDPRWDLPVVGMRTVKLLMEVKASALALTANKTLFFDLEEATALAEKSNIGIIAL